MARRNRNKLLWCEKLEARRLMTADLNGDGQVGFADFLILSDAFGDSVPQFGNRGADINGNGIVGFEDFLILSANYGASVVDFELIDFKEPTNPAAFEMVVTTTEQWNDLIERAHPGSELMEPPVSFDESILIFKSVGERPLGIWIEIDWLMAGQGHHEVGFRHVIGGAAPPPGTQIPSVLISAPRVTDPTFRFVELESIPLP